MSDNRGEFTLEELLRAKRRERPSPEFWTRFERELKSKQRLLIQKELARETRLKSPGARLFKVGAYSAAWGAAAVALYLGFNTPVGEGEGAVAQSEAPPAASAKPTFEVASVQESNASRETSTGLQEFATLAQPSRPRVIVEQSPAAMAAAPTPSQISALETIAALEETIRSKRATQQNASPRYQFVSSTGLFESEAVPTEEANLDGIWDFETAYLLGKYADPFTGTLETMQHNNQSLSEIQSVNFSQIESALSNQGSRRSKTFDAVSVRF